MFPDLGSAQQQAALIVGFFLPLLLAIPIQGHWPDSLKTLFSVAAYAAAGALTAAAAGDLTGRSFWQCTLEVLALGVIGYQGVWKPSGLAPAIATRTDTQSSSPPIPAPAGTGVPTEVTALLSAAQRLLDRAAERVGTAEPDSNGQAASEIGVTPAAAAANPAASPAAWVMPAAPGRRP